MLDSQKNKKDNAMLKCVVIFVQTDAFSPESIMTSSNGNFFHVTGPLCGEFTRDSKRPVMQSFDIFFDLHLNKQLSKQ